MTWAGDADHLTPRERAATVDDLKDITDLLSESLDHGWRHEIWCDEATVIDAEHGVIEARLTYPRVLRVRVRIESVTEYKEEWPS